MLVGAPRGGEVEAVDQAGHSLALVEGGKLHGLGGHVLGRDAELLVHPTVTFT